MTSSACDVCKAPVDADQLVTLGGRTVCARCKPDVVMNLKSGVRTEGAISSERAEEIRKKISRLNLASFAFGLPGLVLAVLGGRMLTPGEPGVGPLVWLVGIGLFITGMVYYARMKGRSGWLGLFGILSCIGLLILHYFPKNCHNCRGRVSYAGKQCDSCGSPA